MSAWDQISKFYSFFKISAANFCEVCLKLVCGLSRDIRRLHMLSAMIPPVFTAGVDCKNSLDY